MAVGVLLVLAATVGSFLLRRFFRRRVMGDPSNGGTVDDRKSRYGTMPRWIAGAIIVAIGVVLFGGAELWGRRAAAEACAQVRSIYDRANNGANLDRARTAATEHGFELDVREESAGPPRVLEVTFSKSGRRIGWWLTGTGSRRGANCVYYRGVR